MRYAPSGDGSLCQGGRERSGADWAGVGGGRGKTALSNHGDGGLLRSNDIQGDSNYICGKLTGVNKKAWVMKRWNLGQTKGGIQTREIKFFRVRGADRQKYNS